MKCSSRMGSGQKAAVVTRVGERNDVPVAPTNSVQIQLIADIKSAMDSRALGWWLFGGWGLDAQLGRITRDHGDVEFWVKRSMLTPSVTRWCQSALR